MLFAEKVWKIIEWVPCFFFFWVEKIQCEKIETDWSIPCIKVEREALSYTPRWAHSLRRFKRNGVPGIGLPRDVINKPMLNIAIPELLSLHGKNTLNSTNDAICWKKFNWNNIKGKQTFCFLRNFSFDTNRNRWWFQHCFIQRLQSIKVIIISFGAWTPCKIYACQFGWYDW